MKAGILAIGTELLMGQTVNTNATYLSKQLNDLGIGVYYHYTVGDNPERIKKALSDLLDHCDLIVTTGGLGPTLDDITKEVIAEALGRKMVLDLRSFDIVKEHFKKFNRVMPESNIRQAYFPEGAIILDNDKGTAPACIVELKESNQAIVVLPGPPRELKHIYDKHVKAYLEASTALNMHSIYLSVYDYGESSVEETLMDLIKEQTNPTIATYAGDGKVLIRVTSSGLMQSENKMEVNHVVTEIKRRMGDFIVSDSGEDIDVVISRLLKERGLKISIVESCTGGKLTSALVKHAGASDIVETGIVTYSNASKIREVGVSQETLQTYGAVSHQTCFEMVKGLIAKTGSDVGISITGIAGPTGGTLEKPVGLVYIGLSIGGDIYTFENKFTGDRELIQNRCVIKALKLLYDFLVKM
jgi:nicotinamide-nucleotide amidase